VWKFCAIILISLFVSGCHSSLPGGERVTPLIDQRPPAAPAPIGRVDMPAMDIQLAEPPQVALQIIEEETEIRVPPLETPPIPPFSVEEWISFEQWAAARRFSRPERRQGSLLPVHDLRTAGGVLSVTAGSRVAKWNGIDLALGFAPREWNGTILVHNLDAEKNFEPLIHPALLSRGDKKIVIDPGHGGFNRGALSVHSGWFEKQYTLDWALRLKPLLEAQGWTVYLTRTNDVDLSLSQRVAFANQLKADLFISLHFNSAPLNQAKPEHRGFETYCLTPVGMPSNLTREFDDNPARVFPNNSFDAMNLQWAFRLHRALVQHARGNDRGVRRARFMTVLQGQQQPAVLLEGGYLSNPEEARLIASPAYRQILAEALAAGLTP
jgi:N-acetylmuramoyl-L-alanine amidase